MGALGAATMAAGAFRTMSRQQELDVLKQEAQQATDVLERIRQRIAELESTESE